MLDASPALVSPSAPAGGDPAHVADHLIREIKQTKPFKSLEEEVSLQIKRTEDHVSYAFVQLFRQEELTGTQYNALRILRGAGPVGLPSGEVGERMVTHVPDITRLLDRLERAKLVKRTRSKQDRRVVTAHITERGLDALARLDEPVTRLTRELLGHMSQDELRHLSALLEKARHPEDTGKQGSGARG